MSLSIVFVCKRRCDEVRREPSSEGAMWCVPGTRFFMPGGYAICLGVTRDSNLSISSATVDGFCGRLARVRRSRSRSWSRGSGNSSSRSRSRRSCGPFAYVSWLQLPPGHGNRAKGQSPLYCPYPNCSLWPVAGCKQDNSISCPLESRPPGPPIDASSSLPACLPARSFHLSDFDLNGNCCQRIRHTFAVCPLHWTMGGRTWSEFVLVNTCVNNAICIPFPSALDLPGCLTVRCPCLACCLIELCLFYSTYLIRTFCISLTIPRRLRMSFAVPA